MKRSAFMLVLLLFFSVAFGSLFQIWVGKAEPRRTIVVPDEYSTIQEAINAANEGDTIFVKKGSYQEETLEISKSLSLLGEDAKETEIYLVPPLVDKQILGATIKVRSTALSINADEVTISNFTFNTKQYVPTYDMDALSANGDGNEIINNIMGKHFNLNLKGDQISVIDNSLASGLQVYGSNQTITGNSLNGLASHGSFSRIMENPGNESLYLYGDFNLVVRNSFSTMYLEYADSNTISNNSLNSLYIGNCGHTCSNNTVSNNKLTGPGPWGILMSAGSYNVFHNNLISNYTGSSDGYGIAIGGRSYVAEHNTFYCNSFRNNNLHVGTNWEILGAGNYWDNGEVGNYWDDYTGTDSDGDGIGDVPYIVEGCKWDSVVGGHVEFVFGQDNYPLMEPTIIPEFPSWTVLPLLLVATLAAVIYRKLTHRSY